ncbi:MAG TPA: 2,3-bisphosphoglycerate-independent phosphoglycerate mutase [Acidiferrobacter sp.]|nr:2,3-bisphosphoglycerate-independent phosphoglycerate mutase [Acidiferrobacter sp.]
MPKPLVLVILDGWGCSERVEGNAIAAARKPWWSEAWPHYPHALIQASEAAVGLPSKQMGNSEVGHLTLGAGRVVYQEYTRINRAIASGAFFANKTLTDAVDLARDTHKSLHILGLLSPGGVHSHEDHIHAMAQLAVTRGLSQVYLHAFLDGRDTPPQSAGASIAAMEAKFAALGRGRFASIIGRYYAMDRDHRWPRIQAAYDLMTTGKGQYRAATAAEALSLAYARGETDEFVGATVIVPPGEVPRAINDGDVVIFMNFRSDRARQISRAFVDPAFDGFSRAAQPKLGRFVSLTEYQAEFHVPVAFPSARLTNVLGSYLADKGKRQLRVAETEKYAHVTFFFNGGEESPFEGEERILVPSPTDVPTYNLRPEMSAAQVTKEVVQAVETGRYDVIICNFANPDMVGHTGDFAATVRAIEVLDGCLATVVAAVRAHGGELLITADHGNAEQMRDPESGQPYTAHTTNPVPLLYVGRDAHISPQGSLEDIAPTLLRLLHLDAPSEMTGRPLIELK